LTATPNMMQRAGAALRRFPPAYKAASLALRAVGLARRSRQIDAYLKANERRYLRIGCGSHTDPGWLATDLLPVRADVVYLDATRRFPLPEASFDAVHCEHVIEHVPYHAALAMLSECRRVLRDGGVLRIATPNIDLVRRLLDRADPDPALDSYVEWSNRTYGADAELHELANPVFAANRLMRSWGHTFIYDEQTLRRALEAAGFTEIVVVRPGASSHPALQGRDRHELEIGRAANELETLALEARA
jgi:predicted SAM-dependent methyltransferase